MSNNKIFIIIGSIVIIIAGVCVGIYLSQSKTTNSTNEIRQNEITNITNTVNEVKTNNVVENKVENKIENTIPSVEPKNTETFTEKPKTQEEKAILIVKKDYGEKNNTEFSVEGMDGKGRQIVVVRNSTTTEALAWYFVDVDNGTFDKQ